MTREEIISMAKGAEWFGNVDGWTFNSFDQLELFVKAIEERAIATEREECAKLREGLEAEKKRYTNPRIVDLFRKQAEELQAKLEAAEARILEAEKQEPLVVFGIWFDGGESGKDSGWVVGGHRTVYINGVGVRIYATKYEARAYCPLSKDYTVREIKLYSRPIPSPEVAELRSQLEAAPS